MNQKKFNHLLNTLRCRFLGLSNKRPALIGDILTYKIIVACEEDILMAESNMMVLPSALDLASQRMGIDRLLPKQLEAVESFVSGKDTFVSLPTGYGKSVIFAILPLLFDLLCGKAGLKSYYLVCIRLFLKESKEALL